MNKQIIILCATGVLNACSWVDQTGSQESTLDLDADASAAQLLEREDYEITLSDQVEQASFVLQSEGSSAAGNCGEYLLPTDSATTLQAACDSRLEPSACQISFSSAGNGKYVATMPVLQHSVALRYVIKAEDINGVIDEQDLTMCLKAVNDAPVAQDHDDYKVLYRETLETSDADYQDVDDTICQYTSGTGVLKGATDDYDFATVDLDSNYPCLSASVETQPSYASEFSLSPLGGFSYTPVASLGPGATDSFTYVANDGDKSSAPKTVTITVIGENDPPEILEISPLVVEQNSEGSIAITSLAQDPEGLALNIAAVDTPSNGTAYLSEDGLEINYTPDEDYVGGDSFNFTVEDVAGAQAQGQIDVTVVRANEAPTIDAPQVQDFDFDNGPAFPVGFDVFVNDREDDSDLLQLSARSSRTSVATVSVPSGISSNGRAAISINPIGNGTATITLTVTDRGLSGDIQRAPKSTTTIVSLTIQNIRNNRAPVAQNDSITVAPGGTATFDLADLTSDADGDSLTYTRVSGSGSLSGDTMTVNTNNADAGNTIRVVYRVSDGEATDDGTLTVRVSDRPNTAPVAQNDSITVAPGGTAIFDLADLTSDADGDSLTYTRVSGSGSLSGDTMTVNTNNADAGNTIRVVYRVSDGEATDDGTLTVRVSDRPNTAPVAQNDSITVAPGGTATFDLADLTSDADGDSLTYTRVSGSGSLSGDTMTVNTNNADAGNTIRVVYRVSDGEATDDGTLTVRVSDLPNTAPVAQNDSITVAPGDTATFDLADLTSDADGDSLTYTRVSGSGSLSGDTMTVNTNNADAGNTIRVVYRVSDGEATDDGTLTVKVSDLPNTAPVAQNDSITVAPGDTATFDLADLTSDADGDSLTYTRVSGNGSLSGDTMTVDTNNADAGNTIRVVYRVSDGEDTDDGTLTVRVSDLPNRAPVAQNDSTTVAPGDTATFDLADLTSDADGDSLTYTRVSGNGSLSGDTMTVNTNNADAGNTITVVYRVSDGEDTDTGTLRVQVDELPNSPPETRSNTTRNIQAGDSTTLDLSTISSDTDGDSLIYSLVDTTAGVELTGSTIRVQTETTAATNTLEIEYRVSDGEYSVTGTLTVNVTALLSNRSPSATNANLVVVAGQSQTLDLNNLINDPDTGDILNVSLISPPPQATLAGTNFSYSSNLTDDTGEVDIEYRVSDGELSDTGTITVTVNAP